MVNLIEHFSKSRKDLSVQEARDFTQSFPDANIKQIKFLDNHLMKLETPENLCGQYFECATHNKVIEAYSINPIKYLQEVCEEIAELICTMPKIKCVEYYRIEAKYNCIGFAIGVIRWENPYDINRHIHNGLSETFAINNYISEKRFEYSADYPANLFRLLHNWNNATDQHVTPKNNTIAFYFKDGECQHAARYITDFNAWVSKLGQWILISHESLDDLKGETYGDVIYYIDPLESNITYFFTNDEL